MNLKHLIIFIVVLLIVLVAHLILNNSNSIYFHGDIECSDILSAEVCREHDEDCAVKLMINNRIIALINVDLTTEANIDNYQTFQMERRGEGDDEEFYFAMKKQMASFLNVMINVGI